MTVRNAVGAEAVFLVLNVVDAVLTHVGLEAGGFEMMPAAALLQARAGFVGLLVGKVVIAGALLAYLRKLDAVPGRLTRNVLVGIWVLVCMWNAVQVFGLKAFRVLGS